MVTRLMLGREHLRNSHDIQRIPGFLVNFRDGGIVTCIESTTGEIRYQERVGGNFFGSPIWVDGRLFAISTAGELVVVRASDKFEVMHRYNLKDLCHTTPAVANERFFVRTEKNLWCFSGVNSL